MQAKPAQQRARCRDQRGALQCNAGLRFFSKPKVQQPQPNSIPAQVQDASSARGRFVSRRAAALLANKPLDSVQNAGSQSAFRYHGVHHVALLVKDLKRSMDFYQGILGLEINPDRPHNKLPYAGAWLWIGPEMIHLMELDNPDPMIGRPEHGGRDRHVCVGVTEVAPLVAKLQAAGIDYTMSKSGRPAVFFRDPDMNCLEVVEQEPWR